MFDLKEHTQQIYTVKWNPAESLMLASYAVRVCLPRLDSAAVPTTGQAEHGGARRAGGAPQSVL